MAVELPATSTQPSPPKFGARLRIEQHGIEPWRARIWLNDQEITSMLQGASIEWQGRRGLTVARLVVAVDTLEVDAQTILNLQAILAAKNAD